MSLKGSDALLQSPDDKHQISFRAEHSEVPSHFHSCIIRITCSTRERPPSSWKRSLATVSSSELVPDLLRVVGVSCPSRGHARSRIAFLTLPWLIPFQAGSLGSVGLRIGCFCTRVSILVTSALVNPEIERYC